MQICAIIACDSDRDNVLYSSIDSTEIVRCSDLGKANFLSCSLIRRTVGYAVAYCHDTPSKDQLYGLHLGHRVRSRTAVQSSDWVDD
jgi:hypothetical protein